MFLTKVLILSCLLTSLVPGPASSFRVDKRGVEVVDWFHFGRKDKPQHQTYAFPAGSRDISAGSAPTESTPTVSSRMGGTPVSCSNPKEKAEIPSQQLQKINDKYIRYTSIQETMFCDLFRFHEQYFEFQEKDFCTSATNVKGRLNENSGFWLSIGANPEILKVLQEGYRFDR